MIRTLLLFLLLAACEPLFAGSGLPGPINHAFDAGPFVFVYPTVGLAPETAVLLRNAVTTAAERFGPTARVVSDAAATDRRLAGHTVIAYGNPAINAYLARVRDRLPIRFRTDGLELGPLRLSGEDLRVVFCCPNPEEPARYLVVYGAVQTRFAANINSVFHGPTDWVVGDRFGRMLWGGFDRSDPLRWRPETSTATRAKRPDWEVHESPHYRFHFLAGSLAQRQIRSIEATQENAWKQSCDFLKAGGGDLARLASKRINYFLYPDRKTKEELTGDRGNGHADIPMWTVHALYHQDVRCLGAHEDTHILAASLWGPMDSALLAEGLSEVIEGNWAGQPHAYWGKKFRAERKVPPLADLLRTNTFRGHPDTVTYPLAGLFVRFLDRRLGRQGLRRLYREASDENLPAALTKALGGPFEKLEREWLGFLGPAPAGAGSAASSPRTSLASSEMQPAPSLAGVPVPPPGNAPPMRNFSTLGKSGTVLLVYGTQDAAHRKELEDLAAQLADFYSKGEGRLSVKATSDRELTERDRASHDLMVVGHAGSHLLLRLAEGRLPAAVGPGGVAVANQRLSGADQGLAFICHDPDHPARLWAVYTGPTFDGMMSIFRVYTGQTGYTVSRGESVVAAGDL